MKIAIDPPAKRSLNPNEQRVLGLLREGLEPLEIARRLHMPLQISNLANRHDVPPDTVMGLIASIREKGWDIPDYNKEDDNMSRGQKTPVKKVHEISILKDEGKTHQQIAEITGVPVSTVGKVCARLGKAETKKEPAPSANDTSSSEENINTNTIVPEIPSNVNTTDKIFCCEVTGDTNIEARLVDREKLLAAKVRDIPTIVWEALTEKIEDLEGKIATAQSDIKEWTDDISKISAFITGCVMFAADEEVL